MKKLAITLLLSSLFAANCFGFGFLDKTVSSTTKGIAGAATNVAKTAGEVAKAPATVATPAAKPAAVPATATKPATAPTTPAATPDTVPTTATALKKAGTDMNKATQGLAGALLGTK